MINRRRIGYRPTWAEVNLRNLAYNFRQIKKLVSVDTAVLVTVKADAYGHGLIPVARTLVNNKVDWLGVASIDEGIALRSAGLHVPVLVMGLVLPEDTGPLFQFDLTPTVCTLELAKALDRSARARKKPIAVHIKVDTGMGRIGVDCRHALEFIRAIRRLSWLRIEGIFTHLACADSDRRFTLRQIGLFEGLQEALRENGIAVPLAHCANSMGVIGYGRGHCTMVRPGLAVYGLYPRKGLAVSLKPVLSLKTRVVFCKRLAKGSSISYGRTYVTGRDTTVATLPIGYGDGYPRNLSNKGPVLIAGRKFAISGRVCMDQIMVDVGNARVRPGDEAVLIGSQKHQSITAEELAHQAGTISYEIVCGLGSRIPRVYIE